MEKSYVSMEQAVCPVCGKAWDTNSLLLDKRLRKVFDRHTPTHFALCPEHELMWQQGFIAFVAIDPDRSEFPYRPDTVYRLGKIAHIKKTAAAQILNVPVEGPLAFCEEGVIDTLKMIARSH